MTIQRRLFALEALVLAMPAIAFLGLTLPEVLRLTGIMLRLRGSANPEITMLQAYSGFAYWAAGAAALGVLAWLVVATVCRQAFTFGVVFWLAAITGVALSASMVGPFGATLAAAISAPLAVLAAHSAALQVQDRKLGQAQRAVSR